MPFTPTGDIMRQAQEAGRGVGAFNVIQLEHAEALVAAAEAVGAPVILQISENAVKYHGARWSRSPSARWPWRAQRRCRSRCTSTT